MLNFNRTSEILQSNGLSLDCTYYLLCGSFADRYFIASMLHHLLEADPAALIFVNEGDREILRIFLGPSLPSCLFVTAEVHGALVQACRQDPHAYMPGNRQGLDWGREIPKGCIRSLHIVDYPYFSALNSNRSARYLDLLRLIMAVPDAAEPRMPPFLEARDHQAAQDALATAGLVGGRTTIVNLVTFSHHNLPFAVYEQMEARLAAHGFAVAFNVAQNNRPEVEEFLRSRVGRQSMAIPGHLMKPVYDRVTLVIGVIGGAMSIADSYSCCHCFTLHTPAVYFPRLDRYPHNPFVYENIRPQAAVAGERRLAWHPILRPDDEERIAELFDAYLEELIA